MIRIGEVVECGSNRGRVGAVMPYGGTLSIVTAAHLLEGGGLGVLKSMRGNGAGPVMVSGVACDMVRVLDGYNLAILQSRNSDEIERSDIKTPTIGNANLFTADCSIPCRIQSISRPIYYVYFRCSDLPMPHDSGAPILQDGAVVGMLSSIFPNNCTGLVVSSDMLSVGSTRR